MNKIKKIILLASAAIASTGIFATELSQPILQQCKNYITNPSKQAAKENAAALNQCYENDVCQNQLSSLKDCTKTLSHWYMSYSPTQTKTETPTTTQIPVSAAPTAQPTTTEVAPTTQPAQQPAETTNNATQQQPKKEKESSINWF